MSINIQVHEVLGVRWDVDRMNPSAPRILHIATLTGEQCVTLFPARPAKPEPTPSENDDHQPMKA